MPIGQIISRGLTAAHSALLGALYLFLLQAPLQVLSAVAHGFQARTISSSEQPPDLNKIVVQSLSLSGGSFVLALAVFFLFPLVQGGILGRVRDRLEVPDQPPGQLGAYGRNFYARLLGSYSLYVLVLIVLMLPPMCIGFGLAFQEMIKANQPPGPLLHPPDLQQHTRQLLWHPAMLVCMMASAFLVSIASIVYWIANCIVVSEQERVSAAWRRSLRFCRRNFSAVLVMWLLSLAVGILISPLSLVGPMGVVKEVWVLATLALLFSAIIGYAGVLWTGVGMSLYLARRPVLVEIA